MIIRKAKENDIDKIKDLLNQVLKVHHDGRPDIFKYDSKIGKYTDKELIAIIGNEDTPVFVADDGEVVGYAFCILQQYKNHNIFTDIKTLYIDDLCVNKNVRGEGIGKKLYDYVLEYAKEKGCYNVTLNVWSENESAMRFYEKCGLKPMKVGMEVKL